MYSENVSRGRVLGIMAPNCLGDQEADLPAASVLICSRDRPQLLGETIQSILKGDEVPTEMVVIDQSKTCNWNLMNFQTERRCEFRYVWSEKKGVSLGRNMAVSIATHPILVFTDDDMLVTPTWFGRIIRTLLASGSHSVVTGQVLSSKEDGEGFAPSVREDQEPVIYRGRVDRDVLSTGNMATYRSAFDQVGGFDSRLGPGTRYPAAEDNDLAFRLLEAGYSIVYDPFSTVSHRVWRSQEQSLWLSWNYGCGQGAFYAKYFSLKDPYTLRRIARNVSGYLLRVPYRILRQRAQAYRDMFYVGGLLYGAARWRIVGGGERV
jgi:glycosyltransferase involved in cell wall biosynthesis